VTSLYFVFVVVSATFSAIFHSSWKSKFEHSTALTWLFAAIGCGSNGSLLLVAGLMNRQRSQIPVLTPLFLFFASLEYVLALFAFVRSIWTLRHHARVQDR
jgi:uncharacterized membrane protein YesL